MKNLIILPRSWARIKPCPVGATGQCCRPMNTIPQTSYTENQLSKIILDAAFKVHTKSGPGLLETVKQVLTQLRLSQRRLALLINFGEVHLKNGIERIVNGLPDETPSGPG